MSWIVLRIFSFLCNSAIFWIQFPVLTKYLNKEDNYENGIWTIIITGSRGQHLRRESGLVDSLRHLYFSKTSSPWKLSMWTLKSRCILHDLACTNPIYTLEYSLKSLLASRWLVIVWWTTTKNLFLSFHPYCYTRSVEDYEHVYILLTSFAWWKPTSNRVNYCRVHMGDAPCTGGFQLSESTSRSEGRHTYLVSSLQMILRKACSDTERFPRLPPVSNLGRRAPEVSALTSRLPRFLMEKKIK